MKRLTLCLLWLLICACSDRNAESVLKDFIYPKTINFGFISKGESKTKEIVLSNEGDEEITLVDIGSSCSCAAIKREKLVIRPHSTKRISLSIFMDSVKNDISEIITIKLTEPLKFVHIGVKAKSR